MSSAASESEAAASAPAWLVRVPASSANIGSGFDVLGIALGLHAEVGVGVAPDNAIDVDEHHPAMIAFRRLGGSGALWARTSIPMARGLGFSGAMRVGGAAAAVVQRMIASGLDALECDEALGGDAADEVFEVAADLEGHGDNAAASVFGGVVVAADRLVTRVPLAFDPATVLWVPDDVTASTDRSRRSLSTTVARADAVFNLGRVATFVAACAAGDESRVRFATEDRLHQDQRLDSLPDSKRALQAALDAGVWAAWLSGSGPTIAAWCESARADEVAAALPSSGHVKVLRIAHEGVAIEWLSGVEATT